MIMNDITIKKVKSITTNLHTFDYLAKEDDYVFITEWENGEGWDVSFNDRMIHLSIGELEAINFLTKKMDYESE
jgi:hypothetical protein